MDQRKRLEGLRRELRSRWYDEGWYGTEDLTQVLIEGSQRWPELRIGFDTTRGRFDLTLSEAVRQAERLAGGLGRLGIGRGSVVAVQLPNWPEALISYMAIGRLAATVLPIVHIYGHAETGYILAESGAQALIAPDQWANIDFLDRIAKMQLPNRLEHVIIVGDVVPEWAVSFADVCKSDVDAPLREPSDPDGRCVLLYTSGTTAAPKGVQHSHNSFLSELRSIPTPPRHLEGVVNFQPFPAGHIAGMSAMLGPFVHGAPTYLVDRWDSRSVCDLVSEVGANAMAGTPFHLAGILDEIDDSGRSDIGLRYVMTGGAGVAPALVRRASSHGWCVVRAYGSSEHPSVTCSGYADSLRDRSETDGRPLSGSEVRIGAGGEIEVIGPDQFIGYTDPALNESAFTEDGWFRTGDIGVVRSGRLTVTGRIKDIIIRGGENLSSAEIEEVIRDHPAVQEVAVLPWADDRYGEVVCAVVSVHTGGTVELSSLRAWVVEAGLARQKAPERLVVVNEMPRTPLGKVSKYELRSLVEAALGSD